MAKDVISVEGKDVVVREDTAKAYRFVHWGVITAAIGLAIIALVLVILVGLSARDGKVESPVQSENSNTR